MLQYGLILSLIVSTPIPVTAALRFRIPLISSFVNRYEYGLLPRDQHQSLFPEPERVVAIGDLHGDAHSFVRILREMNLIDEDMNWSGGRTFLVQMGDFFSKGNESRATMDLLIKLQHQAEFDGGKVIVLIGNHEAYLLNREYRFMTATDARAFNDLIGENPAVDLPEEKVREALNFMTSDESHYGQWLVELPAVVKIGRRLFVHAGVNAWIKNIDIDRLNATMRAWMKFTQNPKRYPKPPGYTEWIIGKDGPMMSRGLAKGDIDASKLQQWMDGAGIDQIVVGHTKVKNFARVTENEHYGDKLIMIDTGISSVAGGLPSAVEFFREQKPKATIFPRSANRFCSQTHLF